MKRGCRPDLTRRPWSSQAYPTFYTGRWTDCFFQASTNQLRGNVLSSEVRLLKLWGDPRALHKENKRSCVISLRPLTAQNMKSHIPHGSAEKTKILSPRVMVQSPPVPRLCRTWGPTLSYSCHQQCLAVIPNAWGWAGLAASEYHCPPLELMPASYPSFQSLHSQNSPSQRPWSVA